MSTGRSTWLGEGWGRENRVTWLVTAAGREAAGGKGMKNVFSVVMLISYIRHIFGSNGFVSQSFVLVRRKKEGLGGEGDSRQSDYGCSSG